MIDYLADICDYFLFKIIFKNIKNKKQKKKDKTFKKHGFNIFPKGQWVTEQSNSKIQRNLELALQQNKNQGPICNDKDL
jgi:hypothetical protein